MLKKMKSIYGQTFYMNTEDKDTELNRYNNSIPEAIYTTPGYYPDGTKGALKYDFAVHEKVKSVEDRLESWDSPVLFEYGIKTDFDADTNDPDGSMWEEIVADAKKNPRKYFDENGDFYHPNIIDKMKKLKEDRENKEQ